MINTHIFIYLIFGCRQRAVLGMDANVAKHSPVNSRLNSRTTLPLYILNKVGQSIPNLLPRRGNILTSTTTNLLTFVAIGVNIFKMRPISGSFEFAKKAKLVAFSLIVNESNSDTVWGYTTRSVWVLR